MKQKDKLRTRNITIRVSQNEYAALQEKFRNTTIRVFSEYCRNLLHQKPVTVFYRSKSLDEFLPVAIALKNDLQTIAQDFNQAVKMLGSTSLGGDVLGALEFFAAEELSVRQKIEEIRSLLIKTHELWSPK